LKRERASGITKEVTKQQKSMERPRQHRKAAKSSKPCPSAPEVEEGKPVIYSQEKPDGTGDRLAIPVAR
jgi:hypothetical protein